jgi:hypothetical protein
VRRALAVSVVALIACRPPETEPRVVRTEPMAIDTLRGTFVLEGSDPYPIAALKTSGGRVIVDGANPGMLKLSQLDLWVRGTHTSTNRFRVTDYRVRGANGARAWDGTLRSAPSGFRLELDDGSSRAIRGAPASFAQLIGTRMWVTERADGTVLQYGVF